MTLDKRGKVSYHDPFDEGWGRASVLIWQYRPRAIKQTHCFSQGVLVNFWQSITTHLDPRVPFGTCEDFIDGK